MSLPLSPRDHLPNGLIAYGPDANCTLTGPDACPVEASVYEYRPTLPGSSVFIALFAITMIIQIIQGVKWRTWAFTALMVTGCISEIIGYVGRIMLYYDPFSFNGFLMQIICITFGPTWYTAAIYLTLSKIVTYLGPEYSRFSPKFYYYIFIPCDIFSLVLQATGGALSSTSSGGSKTAVDVSITGLSLQVVFIVVFIALVTEYVYRWRKGRKAAVERREISTAFKVFAGFLTAAIVLILVRCCYRIDELSDGYNGPLIHKEGLFIGLEGVMIIIAAFCLNVAHPGPAFGRGGYANKVVEGEDSTVETKA